MKEEKIHKYYKMSWKTKILFFSCCSTDYLMEFVNCRIILVFSNAWNYFVFFSIRMTMLLQRIIPRKRFFLLWGSSVPLGCERTKCTWMWWGFGMVFTSGSMWLSGSWKYHWVWFPLYFDLIDKQLTSVIWKGKRKVKWSWRGEHRVIL